MKSGTRTIWTFVVTSIALWIGAAVVGIGAVIALLIPRKRRAAEASASERLPELPQLEPV